MSSTLRNRTVLMAAVAASALFATAADAQEMRFNVPSQEANKSIPEFARQARLQIIAPAAGLRGVRTQAVQGTLDAREALSALLEGTGLEIGADNGSTVALRVKAGQGRPKAIRISESKPLLLAQSSVATGAVSDAAPATVHAAPPARNPEPASLSEVIVTAQKREQRLTDVPQAISVTSGDELRARAITNLDQIGAIAPAFKISTPYVGGTPSATLRGLGPANQYNFNTNAPIGFYQDEVYMAFVPAPAVQFFDLERVEVLKGPQGTLYGRNTTGGLLNFISREPSLSGGYNGDLEVGYGSRETWKIQGATDLQIVPDQLAARVAFLHTEGDGYIKNARPGGNRTFGADDTWQGRLVIKYAPSENFDAVLRASINKSDNTGSGPVSPGIGPGGTNVAGYSRAGLGRYEVEYDFDDGVTRTRAHNIALNLNWYAGDFKFTSITSGVVSKARLSDDCDGSPISLCAIDAKLKGRQFSEDLRAQYSSDKLNLTAGFFYGQDRMSEDAPIDLFGSFFPRVLFEQKRKSYAVYFDGSYNVTDKLELTVGLRQTWDKVELRNAQTLILASSGGQPVASTVPPAAPYVPGLVLAARSRSPSALTGRFIVKYQMTPDVMAYASYSHGYRAGAFNGQALASPDELNYVDPEKVDNYELGLKGGFFDRKLTLSAVLFNSEIKNQHVQTTRAALSVLGGLDGYTRGLEVEATAAVTSALRLNLAVSALKTRYDNNQLLSGVPVGGNRFALAPKLAVQGGFDWTAFETDDSRLKVAGDFSYSGQYFFEPQNGRLAVSPILNRGQRPFTLFNGRVSYEVGAYTFSAWGRNLTNRHYVSYASDNEGFFGNVFQILAEPRTMGVTAAVSF